MSDIYELLSAVWFGTHLPTYIVTFFDGETTGVCLVLEVEGNCCRYDTTLALYEDLEQKLGS